MQVENGLDFFHSLAIISVNIVQSYRFTYLTRTFKFETILHILSDRLTGLFNLHLHSLHIIHQFIFL